MTTAATLMWASVLAWAAAALPAEAASMSGGAAGLHGAAWRAPKATEDDLSVMLGGAQLLHGRMSARALLTTSAGNSSNSSSSSDAQCNCSTQAARLPVQSVLQICDHYGMLPQLRHWTYLYQGLLVAQGSQSVVAVKVQQFNSPRDLASMETLNPDYDIAQVEQRVSTADTGFFTAPAWLSAAGSSAPDAATVQAALKGLLAQGNSLVDNMPILLAYRRDLLAARGLAAPETWAQMLDMAALLNGTDMNGDGVGDYALCVDVDPSCKTYWIFSAVAASMLQYNGTASGYLIDPTTGDNLLDTPGMQKALSMWAQLLQYNAPEQATKGYCGMWEDAFTQGRCLFTLGPLQSSSHTYFANGTIIDNGTYAYSWGRTGVAPTPGSTSVYDRKSGKTVACSPTACPLATPAQQQPVGAPATVYVNRAPVVMRSDNGRQDTRTNKVTALNLKLFASSWTLATQSWIFSALDPIYLADPYTSQSWEQVGLQMQGVNYNYNLTYYNSSQYVQDAYAWVGSLATQATTVGWVSPTAVNTTANPEAHPIPWMGVADFMGLEVQEATEHLTAAVWSLVHPNLVPDPQMVSPLRITLAVAASCMTLGVNQSLVEGNIAYKLGLWEQEPPNVWNQVQYDQDIGYKPSAPSPRSGPGPWANFSAPGGPSQHISDATIAGIVVTSVAVVLLLLVAALIALRLRAKAGLDAFGKIRAPGLGPSTSILVTDIQSSTTLWEVLPPGVMDRAVRLHHELVRGLMKEHKGYETCTEGDSFIVAFHTPWDALRYCLAVQTALLSVEWPEELLTAPEAADDAAEVQLRYNNGAMDWCAPRGSACASHAPDGPGASGPQAAFKRLPCLRQRVLARLRGESAISVMLREQQRQHTSQSSSARSSPSGGAPARSSRSSISGIMHTLGLANWERESSSSLQALEALDGGSPYAQASNSTLFFDRSTAPAHGRLSSDEPSVAVQLEDEPAGRRSLSGKASSGRSLATAKQQQGELEPKFSAGVTLQGWLTEQVRPMSGLLDDMVPTTAGLSCGQTTPRTGQSTPRCKAAQAKLVENVALRGLRVRMGLHSGLTDPQGWAVNKATGRWCASGPFLATCKAVGDAGAGGMIVLSRDFWNTLMPFGVPPDCVVLHMGEHQLKDQEGSMALYLALPAQLVSRLAVLPPLRSLALTSPSVLSAPLGHAAVVFMHAVGVNTLRAWSAELTHDSLQIYHETVSRALLEWGGYLMELVDGLCLASFADPGAAVAWALSAQADLLTQAWDPRVLRHELCEEVSVIVRGPRATPSNDATSTSTRPLSHEQLPPLLPRRPLSPLPLAAIALAGASDTPTSSVSGAEPLATSTLRVGSLGRLGTKSFRRMVTLGHSGRLPVVGAGAPAPTVSRLAVPSSGPGPEGACGQQAAADEGRERDSSGAYVLHKRVLLRGLRIKAGIAVGEVHTSLNPATGRMSYWGKVMNRAARIAGQATSSQVLCSSLAWSASCSSALPRVQATPILGTSLGPHALKGIADKVTLVHCTLDLDAKAGHRDVPV